MQQNINPYLCQKQIPYTPVQGPNAVNINIVQPQAYASDAVSGCCSSNGNYYPLYQPNQNTSLPLYPMNYNNLIYPYSQNQQPYNNNLQQYPNYTQYQQPNQMPDKLSGLINPADLQNGLNGSVNNGANNGANSGVNAYSDTNLYEKTPNSKETVKETTIKESQNTESKDKKKETKAITVLTDDYVKSLENYLNDSNPKVRLIAAKELMERFKEDDSRINHPSLVPLLNKMLRDTSPSVRFLGLTTLQLGYSVGDDETVKILKEIQAKNQDKLGEDALLASEILLRLSAPIVKEVK